VQAPSERLLRQEAPGRAPCGSAPPLLVSSSPPPPLSPPPSPDLALAPSPCPRSRCPHRRPPAAFSPAAGRPPCDDRGRRQAGPRLRRDAAAMGRGGHDDRGPRRRRLALGGAFVCRSVFASSTLSVVAASTAGSRGGRGGRERAAAAAARALGTLSGDWNGEPRAGAEEQEVCRVWGEAWVTVLRSVGRCVFQTLRSSDS
jgi:hypothetical protein